MATIRSAFAGAMILAWAPVVLAQPIAGAVRDSATRAPVVGAVVLLLGQRGDTIARTLTDVNGGYRLVRPPGAARPAAVRAVRMGFAPSQRPIGSTGGARLDLAMDRLATLIQAVNVRAPARCPRRADGPLAFGLWEQARASLLASVVARDAVPSSKRRIRYEQRMVGLSSRVAQHVVGIDGAVDVGSSFSAAKSVRDFIRSGFTELDAEGDTRYFSPDAEVILDPAFAEHYCLAIVRAPRDRRQHVGLEFAPADRHRVTVDVTGVIWVDTLRRSLVSIEYEYTGMTWLESRADPGGRLTYREFPSGVVLMDEWEVRMVGNEVDTSAITGEVQVSPRKLASRVGGALSEVAWPDGTLWRAPLGTFSGYALRRDGTPAYGVVLRLDRTDYRSPVDSSGAFLIRELVPGPYRVLVEEPRLASLDLLAPTTFRFESARDSVLATTLLLPDVEELVSDRCARKLPASAKASGQFLGRIFLPDGRPAGGVDVRLRAQPLQGSGLVRTFTTQTEPDGTFAWCDNRLTRGTRFRIEVPMGPEEPLRVEHTLTSSLTIMRIGMP